ncbi:MAG: PhnD/SsuA/transferrin family substrate-binding protein, partial [Actinomycetota bacterium]|nr:PhnD/SsuA/transferrin family substrate-binding protein [Actinomycetota bacterium]
MSRINYSIETLHTGIRRLLGAMLLLAVLCPITLVSAAEVVKIGVLSFRPKPQTLAQWQPLGEVLARAIPEREFVVEALNYSEMEEAVASRRIDFVLTNPGHYVLLTRRIGLTAPLATLAVNDDGRAGTVFGGVIFV